MSKQLPASSKKLRDARKKGDIARSAMLAQGLVLLIVAQLSFLFCELLRELALFLEKLLVLGADFHTKDLLLSALQQGWRIGIITFFLLLLCSGGALCIEIWQSGFQFLPGQLWQPERLNLAKGFKRQFELESPGSVPESAVRLFVVVSSWLLLVVVKGQALVFEAAGIDALDVMALLLWLGSASSELFTWFGCMALGIATLDYMYSCTVRKRRLRMDREELKREFKESEGDPALLAKRKQLHSEVLSSEMTNRVRGARVVVVN